MLRRNSRAGARAMFGSAGLSEVGLAREVKVVWHDAQTRLKVVSPKPGLGSWAPAIRGKTPSRVSGKSLKARSIMRLIVSWPPGRR
jgi:hypothetical protein